MSEVVTLERDGPVAWITLNRPESLNAINDAVRAALPDCVRAAEADPDLRVLVLRGAGSRAFCAGADIKEFAPVDAPAVDRQARASRNWIAAFDAARKPMIASIHGYCLGGGLEIALACDLRVAASNAVFGFPETGLGIMTGIGGSQRLPRIVGLGLALDMMLSGERLDATRSLDAGLVTRTCPPDDLSRVTRELALTVAAKAPLATAYAKEAVHAALDVPLAAGMRREVDLLSLLLTTEDRLEAARAFKEKRSPSFSGR